MYIRNASFAMSCSSGCSLHSAFSLWLAACTAQRVVTCSSFAAKMLQTCLTCKHASYVLLNKRMEHANMLYCDHCLACRPTVQASTM